MMLQRVTRERQPQISQSDFQHACDKIKKSLRVYKYNLNIKTDNYSGVLPSFSHVWDKVSVHKNYTTTAIFEHL